jgi:hypothetical protein
MKTRSLFAALILVGLLLFGCDKDEIIAPKAPDKVNQTENSLIGPATNFLVTMSTGGDDLRGGNRAFLSLELMDGLVTAEQVISTGLGGGSTVVARVSIPRRIAAYDIRAIRIRHDGNPRHGHPFDTYDNWDLRTLRVQLANAGFRPISLLYDSERDSRAGGFVARFSGALRQIDKYIRAKDDKEPDFIIQNLTATAAGLRVQIKNQGPGWGMVTLVQASAFGGAVSRLTSLELNPGQTGSVIISPPLFGRVSCSITGIGRFGYPERVTANNRYILLPVTGRPQAAEAAPPAN